MKIAIVCDEKCSHIGDKYYLREFGQILINRYLTVFDEVRLIVRTLDVRDISELGKFSVLISDPRVEIYPIPYFQGPIEYAKEYFKVRTAIKKSLFGCEAAIFRLPSALGFAVCSLADKQCVPFAVELVYDCKDGYGQAHGVEKILWWKMHQKQVLACRKAIAIAPVTSKYLQSHYDPIEKDIIRSHYSSVEMGKEFYYEPRVYPKKKILTIVHVANQVQFKGRKGHEDVITSIKILKDKGIQIEGVFVGEDYDNGIRKLAEFASTLGVEDQISFTGYLSSEKMRQVLISSDIAVMPTKAEGLPRVVIEAMAIGLPCITTNVSGNPELIDEEFLFNYGDTEAIVRLVLTLINDREKYEATSKRNFEKSQEFSKSVLDNRRKEFFCAIRHEIENK